jgi:anti-sigma-K factor RskA
MPSVRPGGIEMDYSRADRADALAADYVTGTLRGAARRRFEALLPAHPALRHAVRAWQARLMPMTLSVEPVQPSPEVWKRIEARIAPAQPDSRAAAASSPRLAFWRALAAFASVAALALSVLLATPGPALPPVVIVLNATEAATAGAAPSTFIASISGDGRAVVTRPLVNVALQNDRALELWALPASGAPRSLGVISANGATVVQRTQDLKGAAALAVSLEPLGGSPTGAPTGPVLYVGKLTL